MKQDLERLQRQFYWIFAAVPKKPGNHPIFPELKVAGGNKNNLVSVQLDIQLNTEEDVFIYFTPFFRSEKIHIEFKFVHPVLFFFLNKKMIKMKQ